MLIQIAILAWIFLGEGISLQEIIGMAVGHVPCSPGIDIGPTASNHMTLMTDFQEVHYAVRRAHDAHPDGGCRALSERAQPAQEQGVGLEDARCEVAAPRRRQT